MEDVTQHQRVVFRASGSKYMGRKLSYVTGRDQAGHFVFPLDSLQGWIYLAAFRSGQLGNGGGNGNHSVS